MTVGGPKIAGPANAAIDAINSLRSGVIPANQDPVSLIPGFWAMIKTAAIDANNVMCYQFVSVVEYEAGKWGNAPQTDGDPTPGVYAYEVNGFGDVPTGSIVWMMPNGYSTASTSEMLYVFQYGQQGFWARLHDASSYNYQFTQVVEGSAGTWTDVPNGIASTTANGLTAQEVNGVTGIPDGTRVWIVGQFGGNSPRLYAFMVGGSSKPGATYAVLVTQDGGAQGDKTTKATWTFTWTDLSGSVTLGTGTQQLKPVPTGRMALQPPGSYGLGFDLADGTHKLWDAGLAPGTTGC
jgi:hypothetical protein